MLKLIYALTILFGSFPVFCSHQEIPRYIDFGSKEFENNFFHKEFSSELVRTFPFNGAVQMSTFFMYLKEVYNIQTVIETGTFKGNTAGFFGSVFDLVHTIEITPEFYRESEANLKQFPNVICHLGSSPVILRQTLPTLTDQPVLFYLDAHWYIDWPLLDELTEISKTHSDNCVIVIDDFKVPGRNDIPYDSSPTDEYAFEYVQNHLNRIFREGYTIHYLIPKDLQSRAKFVAIPKKWNP